MPSGLRPYGIDRDKPRKVIDAQEIAADRATHRIARLNVAGPRRSKVPKAEAFARAVIRTLLTHECGDQSKAGAVQSRR